MRIGVFSDSHGDGAAVERLLRHNICKADCWLFAGDGLRDIPQAWDKPIYTVRGNSDFFVADAPLTRQVWLEDTGILLCHGHGYHVEYGLETLAQAASDAGVQLAVYGHTHIPSVDWVNGVLLVNPGSLTRGRSHIRCSYAVIEAEGGTLRPRIYQI